MPDDRVPAGIVVRRLGADDLATFDAMLGVFGDAFEAPETYGGHRPSPAWVRALLGSDGFVAFAALDGTEVVGALAAYVLPKFEQERREVYLYDLAVAASQRRRGIATALIRALQEAARALGAWVVFVQADRGDDPAIALYSKLGVREEVLHFDLPVGPPA